MAKVDFRRVATNAEINNIEVKDGQFIVTGEGQSYVDFGEERVPIAGTPDTQMSDSSTNTVENKVIKEYVDNINKYDTTRTKIGMLGNKPLYRKIIEGYCPTASSETTAYSNKKYNIDRNIDTIIIEWANAYDSSNDAYQLPNYDHRLNGRNVKISTFYDSGDSYYKVIINSNQPYFNNYLVKVSVLYTLTTD